MKKIELLFYSVNPSPTNIGLKHVLWAITDAVGVVTHDWGFAEWGGANWGAIDVPEGYTATVAWWGNTVDPELLVKEKSKIITLGGPAPLNKKSPPKRS